LRGGACPILYSKLVFYKAIYIITIDRYNDKLMSTLYNKYYVTEQTAAERSH